MDNNVKIVQIYNNQPSTSADFYYRIHLPAKEITQQYNIKWYNIINLYENKLEIVKDTDLFIINFVCDNDILPIIEFVKEKGIKVIYEINDNFLSFQPSNPMYEFYSDKNNQALMYQIISYADGITLTTPLLIEKLNIKNKNIAIFPNNIESISPLKIKKSEKIYIGWGGSSGHYEDIKEISDILIELVNKYENVYLAIKSDRKIKEIFSSKLPEKKFIWEEFGSLDSYYNFLKKLHIGICTIKKDNFNYTRSDIKYLEYVANSVLPICSNFGPYSLIKENCILYNNKHELKEKIEFFINNPQQIEVFLKKFYNYVKNSRIEKLNSYKRIEFYQKFINKKITKGRGELIWIDKSSEFPQLYEFLIGKIEVKKEFNHPLFILKKYYNNLEKIKEAIFEKNIFSINLIKRYIELLIYNGEVQEAISLLEEYIKKYPYIADFYKLYLFIFTNYSELIKNPNLVKLFLQKLKKLQPYLFEDNL